MNRESLLNASIVILLLAMLIEVQMMTPTTASPEASVFSNWLIHPVTFDGRITTDEEWSDATPVDLTMRSGDGRTTSARLWTKNNDEWLNILLRIEWPVDVDPEDWAYIVHFSDIRNDIGGVKFKNFTLDGYGYDRGEWSWDTGASPPGRNDVEGAASHDGTYYWFEFAKRLDSGDGYDWTFVLGETYDGKNLGICLRDESENRDYKEPIALHIASATFDFSMTVSPSAREVTQGESTGFTVGLSLLGGAPVSVDLSLTGLPEHASYAFTPSSGDPPFVSTLEVTTTEETSPRTYTLTVTGSDGGVTRTKTMELTVAGEEEERVCIIATATYGSELAPEVQFLRRFRDSVVLSTFAGGQVMRVFNAWYYSFSPSVARFISGQPLVKMVMKGILYPLIGILHLSSMVYSAFSFGPELGVVVAGLVASSLIGVVYFTLPATVLLAIVKRFKKKMLKTKQLKLLAIPWLVSVVLMLLEEIILSPEIMMAATASFVLTTLASSATLTASKIVQHLL